jgi:alpha-amylase
MAIDVCFYFQVHQPWRLRPYRYLEVGRSHHYFDDEKNAQILRKVADKCYLPMNNLLLELLNEHRGELKFAFSITGSVLRQMEEYAPEVIASFRRLFETGQVELLSETSHHSLAALYSPAEFREQVSLHREQMLRHLGVEPSRVFRNTELIVSNEVARLVGELGFQGILMEGADHVLRWRSPLFKYRMAASSGLVGLMKNYRLSDDIAFRFSDRGWAQWPLTSEKYAEWVRMIEGENPVTARGGTPLLGLFMDYETFGEHQWASTGIFDFMRALPAKLLKTGSTRFVTPTEAVSEALASQSEEPGKAFVIDAPQAFSWADVERDLSAWKGNAIQDAALKACYGLESAARERAGQLGLGEGEEGAELLETWRRLQTSDHFYYMCTKYFADGDVHKYFNPFESPYDAHIIYMNVMADFARELGLKEKAIAS